MSQHQNHYCHWSCCCWRGDVRGVAALGCSGNPKFRKFVYHLKVNQFDRTQVRPHLASSDKESGVSAFASMEHFAWNKTFSMFPEESVTCESQVSHECDTSVCELKTH
eukprot:scaffold1867_cov79-Skeletonema_menzelii.AAC.1